jgi:hypothetical protein
MIGKLLGAGRPAVKICGAVPRDRRNPAAEGGGVTQMIEPAPRGQEHVLYQILDVAAADPREQQPVHHPDVSLVQACERDAVSGARPPNQGGILGGVFRAEPSGHDETRPDAGDIHLHGRTFFHQVR